MMEQNLSEARLNDLSTASADAAEYADDESATTTDAGGKYVYCIIRHEEPRDFGEIGIGGSSRVYTVHHRDLAAVVSDTPIVIYDPTRENVLEIGRAHV